MVEQAAVNRKVVGSSPTSGATLLNTKTDVFVSEPVGSYSTRLSERATRAAHRRPQLAARFLEPVLDGRVQGYLKWTCCAPGQCSPARQGEPIRVMVRHVNTETGDTVHGRAVGYRRLLAVAGVASLANGAALVLHILGGIPLPVLLAVCWSIAACAVVGMGYVGGAAAREAAVLHVTVGLGAGIVATLAYDATKAVLAQLDPSPYNPFEVTRIFGTILIGASAPPAVITTVGWAFHLANGCTFAIAYSCFFARGGRISTWRAVATGVAWGLFLETFQLALYPGWLKVGFLDEFRRISFAAHMVFGAGLGWLVPAGLRHLRAGIGVSGGIPAGGA
jgi:hypothetical protein